MSDYGKHVIIPDRQVILAAIFALALLLAAFFLGMKFGERTALTPTVTPFLDQLAAVHSYMERSSQVQWAWRQEYCREAEAAIDAVELTSPAGN